MINTSINALLKSISSSQLVYLFLYKENYILIDIVELIIKNIVLKKMSNIKKYVGVFIALELKMNNIENVIRIKPLCYNLNVGDYHG